MGSSPRYSNRPIYGKTRFGATDDALAPETVNKSAVAFPVRDFSLVFFKYRLLIVATFLATMAGTLLWLCLKSDSYETTAKVMIKFAREVTDPRTSLSPTSSSSSKMMALGRVDINTEAELIKSFSVLQQVVTKLGLDQVQPEIPPPGLVARLKFELRRAYRSARDFLDTAQVRIGLKQPLTAYESAVVLLAQGLKVEGVKESSIVNVTLSSPFKQ